VRDDASAASPLLEPIDSKDHLHLQLTTVPPPESSCGAVELGTPATGANAGTPGTTTPANSYLPDSVDEMDSITASPSTDWSAGQYVRLSDGSNAYWNGTDWVAGIHP